MKKIIIIAVAVVLIVAGVVLIPRLVHTCENCDALFFGTGYEVPSLFTESDGALCKDCAEKAYGIFSILGGDVSDFKKPLF